MFKRVALFVGTNVAVLALIAIVSNVLGVERWLAGQGSDLDLTSLLIFSAIVGFAGSFVSLAISKWSAKMATGAKVIEQPSTPTESLTRESRWRRR